MSLSNGCFPIGFSINSFLCIVRKRDFWNVSSDSLIPRNSFLGSVGSASLSFISLAEWIQHTSFLISLSTLSFYLFLLKLPSEYILTPSSTVLKTITKTCLFQCIDDHKDKKRFKTETTKTRMLYFVLEKSS